MHRVQQAAAVFVACWACSASADTADVVPEPETPAELAAFLRHCATLLGPRDYGLARVARQCPGVEYHVLHGPLAEALRDPHWAATVSRAGLLELAAVADTYGRPSAQALDRASLAIELERSQDHEQVARGWWKRFNDWLERVFAQPEDAPDPDNWLGRLLRKVFADGPSAATVERISVGIVIAMALAVLAIGWWQFSPNRRARRRARQTQCRVRQATRPTCLRPCRTAWPRGCARALPSGSP